MKALWRWGRWVGLAGALVVFAACNVGSGEGDAVGALYVNDCEKRGGMPRDFGNVNQPATYELNPEFFAGEPIDDIKPNGSSNRLIIRLQSSGKRIEVNDFLVFDVVSVYEVARCVRGNVWDARTNTLKAGYDERHCSRGPNGTGPARVRIGPNQPIRAYFAPRTKCPNNTFVIAMAVAIDPPAASGTTTTPRPASEWESWIEFAEFGAAGSVGANPAEPREIARTFKIEFGDRLYASRFKVVLEDDQVVKARLRNETPPTSEIRGSLDGFFRFTLERGQGAQTFP